MKNKRIITVILLNVLLLVYSLSGVLSKKAAMTDFLSLQFCLCYGGIIFLLGVYAICWQQIIKILPLTTAFANKAITIIWGILWSYIFFGEKLSVGKGIGAGLVACGIVLYAIVDGKGKENG